MFYNEEDQKWIIEAKKHGYITEELKTSNETR